MIRQNELNKWNSNAVRDRREVGFCQITRAQSPGSQINTAESAFNWLANSGWSSKYSLLTYDAASSARSASTSARQHPLNPAPLKRAPNTPGALWRISFSCINGSQPLQ